MSKHRFNNHTKSFNLEYYEKDTELTKEYWTIKRNRFTSKVTWITIRKSTPFNTTKRKCYLCLNEKLEITKANSPFYGMIARIKSYVFAEVFLVVFPLWPPFWPERVNVLHDTVFKTKIEQLKMTVSLEKIVGNISSEKSYGSNIIYLLGYH